MATDLAGSTPTPPILSVASEIDNFQVRVGLQDVHDKIICSCVTGPDVSASPAVWQLSTQNSITGWGLRAETPPSPDLLEGLRVSVPHQVSDTGDEHPSQAESQRREPYHEGPEHEIRHLPPPSATKRSRPRLKCARYLRQAGILPRPKRGRRDTPPCLAAVGSSGDTIPISCLAQVRAWLP